MVEIIPGINSKTGADYHRKFKSAEPFSEWFQIDIVDGRFAPVRTIGAKDVAAYRTKKNLEIQLMVNFIEDWIDDFVKIQAVKRIVFPVETAHNPLAVIHHLKRHKIQVGVSINPHTSAKRLEHIISHLDTALILSVNPGFSGQHFVHSSVGKIKEIKGMNPNVRVEVDGGITPGTARKLAEEGADILISSSFIFDNANIEGETYRERIINAMRILKDDVEGLLPSKTLER